MALRIESGTLRGMVLKSPRGEGTRPTSSKVRAAVFSMLGCYLEDARVLDLYAGTGSFGIGALSHGASHVTFVERDRQALKCLRMNLLEANRRSGDKVKGFDTEVLPVDVLSLLNRSTKSFDLIWLDPPYHDVASHIHKLWPFLEGSLSEGGSVIVESGLDAAFESILIPDGKLQVSKTKKYGKTQITVLS